MRFISFTQWRSTINYLTKWPFYIILIQFFFTHLFHQNIPPLIFLSISFIYLLFIMNLIFLIKWLLWNTKRIRFAIFMSKLMLKYFYIFIDLFCQIWKLTYFRKVYKIIDKIIRFHMMFHNLFF